MSEGEDTQLEAWIERIQLAGLTPILIPLLELARALGLVASQLFLLGEPLFAGTAGQSSLQSITEWLEDPQRVDRLLAQLEDSSGGE